MEAFKKLQDRVMNLLSTFEKEETGNKLSQFSLLALRSLVQQEFENAAGQIKLEAEAAKVKQQDEAKWTDQSDKPKKDIKKGE